MFLLAGATQRKILAATMTVLGATVAGCHDEVPEPKSTTQKTAADVADKGGGVATAPAVLIKPAEPATPIVRPYAVPAVPDDPPLSKVVIRDRREWDLPESA